MTASSIVRYLGCVCWSLIPKEDWGFSMAQLVLKYYGNKVDLKEYYLSSEESM